EFCKAINPFKWYFTNSKLHQASQPPVELKCSYSHQSPRNHRCKTINHSKRADFKQPLPTTNQPNAGEKKEKITSAVESEKPCNDSPRIQHPASRSSDRKPTHDTMERSLRTSTTPYGPARRIDPPAFLLLSLEESQSPCTGSCGLTWSQN
ncbi:hypothetical protein BaRGS_00019336, partial [Batillaria attramentaria]